MKFNLKYLIYLPIIFLFLPAFSFYMPGIKKVYSLYYISMYFALFIMFIQNYKCILSNLINIIRKTPLIYFFLFLIFGAINSIVLSFWGISTLKQIFTSLLMNYFLNIVLTIIYFVELLTKYISLKNFIKIFLFLFWLNLVLGIISYLSRMFSIEFINNVFSFFANERILASSTIGSLATNAEDYFDLHKRLTGLFAEPGFLGRFLFIFLPFTYSVSQSKIILFSSRFNKIFIHTIIPLTWINIILTLSPISLCFSLLITYIYYFNNIYKFIKKNIYILIFIFAIFMTLLILFNNNLEIDLSSIYIMRIINVVINIRSIDDFISIEPSLATRFISYINEFRIFLKYPFTGVGIANSQYYMFEQFITSPVPLTPEIIYKTNLYMPYRQCAMYIESFISSLFAQNGLFIGSLFFYFYYKLFSNIQEIYSFINKNSFDYLLIKSIKFILIACFIEFFYEIRLTLNYFILILVLSSVLIYKHKILEGRTSK